MSDLYRRCPDSPEAMYCGDCDCPHCRGLGFVPVTIDYEALRERVCRRIHAVGPASLNASQVTQLKLAMDDIRAALGGNE